MEQADKSRNVRALKYGIGVATLYVLKGKSLNIFRTDTHGCIQ